MGGPGSGKPRQHKTVESCPILDVDYLSAQGRLQPGWVGIWQGGGGDSAAITIYLRAEARQLRLSWCSPPADNAKTTDNATTNDERTSSAETANEKTTDDPTAVHEDATEIIPIVQVPIPHGGSRLYFICPGIGAAGCGQRANKLYLTQRHRFLCRHCSGLVYASQYETPAAKAVRHANEAWWRLDSAMTAEAAGRAIPMPEPVYERLIEEAMAAEAQATEAQAARLQRLVAWLEKRRGPQFTL
jgi:hypothetical protein